MITYTDYRFPGTNRTEWSVYTGSRYDHFTPEELAGDFLDKIENTKETIYTFSNLSIVGIPIIYTLLQVGYNLLQGNPKVKEMKERDIKYMVAGNGAFYSITVKRRKRGILIIDSDNIITLSERQDIIDSWGAGKGDNPEQYCRAVYKAVSGVINRFDKKKPTTISSAARRAWATSHDDYYVLKQWVQDCRNLEVNGVSGETYLRPAYHGGLCAINYENVNSDGVFTDVGEGLVLDINGMYPYIMSTYPMPYGVPHDFKGKPDKETLRLSERGYVFFFVHFRAEFDLKPDGIPCVSVTGTTQSIMHERGWLTTSKYYNRATGEYYSKSADYDGKVQGNFVELTLTQTDFSLFLDNYEVHKIEYIDGCWFPTSTNLFVDYVNFWQDQKHEAENEGNKGKRRIAKMFENSLSGNMARRTSIENLVISYDESTNSITTDVETLSGIIPSHVHIGAAITSYGRSMLIGYIKKYKEFWLYSDTDSLHFKNGIDLSLFPISDKLGDFKVEKTFTGAYYYKQKMYAQRDGDGVHLTFAGIPKASVRYLEDLLSGRDPDRNPKADFIEPSLTEEQNEAIELLFAGNQPEDFDEIMEESSSQQLRFSELKDEIEKLREKGDPLKGLYFLMVPVWERHSDGWQEFLHVTWRPVANMNRWAQV